MKSKNQVVIGLGFGDEGKGLTTSYLMSSLLDDGIPACDIVNCRFNGGQQAGHTVVYDGKRHIFSQIGSAAFQGADTYISEFCTFYPPDFYNELTEFILKHGSTPIIYLDPLTKITTPYDILHNRMSTKQLKNGTVGMGFGQTIARHEDHYTLYAKDLVYPKVFEQKLKNIGKYYGNMGSTEWEQSLMKEFYHSVEYLRSEFKGAPKAKIRLLWNQYPEDQYVIYEGAQGVLLDMEHGFFPNVTRSKTTIANVLDLIGPNEDYDLTVVTRTYQTRHGNGFMTNEDVPLVLKNNENETNVSHEFQGEFRTAPIDFDLLNYALDSLYMDMNDHLPEKFNLMITCNDQHEVDIDNFLDSLHTTFQNVFLSYGSSATDVKNYNDLVPKYLDI